jgi:hypothetical protein
MLCLLQIFSFVNIALSSPKPLIERLWEFAFCIFLKERAKPYAERVVAEERLSGEPTNGRRSEGGFGSSEASSGLSDQRERYRGILGTKILKEEVEACRWVAH